MERELAKRLMARLIACHKAIDSAELVSREIEDKKVREEFKKILGSVSVNLYSAVMGKIILEYPDLDPYSKDNLEG